MKKIKVAVTGGIGSGKSSVCNILSKKGYECFSCDGILRELWMEEEYQKGLITLFPTTQKNGKIDKTLLSELVFSNATELKRLNAFSHPQIMKRLYARMKNSANRLVFAEVPLLFEGGYEKDFDAIIVVCRDKSLRILATMQRDLLTKEQVEERIKQQFDYHRSKLSFPGCFIIENNDDIISLEEKIEQILENIMKL